MPYEWQHQGGTFVLQAWLRTAVTGLVVIALFVILIVFLMIALKIALLVALLAVAYYFFHRALAARRSHRD